MLTVECTITKLSLDSLQHTQNCLQYDIWQGSRTRSQKVRLFRDSSMGIKIIIRLPMKNQCTSKESQEGVLSNILKSSKSA